MIYAHRTHNQGGHWGQAESFHWWHHASSSTVSKGSNLRKRCHHNNICACESKLFRGLSCRWFLSYLIRSKSPFIHPQNKPNWQKAIKLTVHSHAPQRMKPLWTLHYFFSCTTLKTNCHFSVQKTSGDSITWPIVFCWLKVTDKSTNPSLILLFGIKAIYQHLSCFDLKVLWHSGKFQRCLKLVRFNLDGQRWMLKAFLHSASQINWTKMWKCIYLPTVSPVMSKFCTKKGPDVSQFR